jgi:hypothetical protein
MKIQYPVDSVKIVLKVTFIIAVVLLMKINPTIFIFIVILV